MISRTTDRFRANLAELPGDIRLQAREAYRLFQQDPFDYRLKLKRLSGKSSYWSVRIGLNYRAVGLREGDVIQWFWIGSHAEYDALLQRL